MGRDVMTAVNAGAPVRTNVISDPVRPAADEVPIEPVGQLETPKPFHAGIGTWAGVAGATLLGGAVGTAVGGIGALAMFPEGGGGSGVLLIGAGLAAATLAGIFTYGAIESSHDRKEQARVQRDFGTSTLDHAKDLIKPFDHDQDGAIDLVNTSGLASQDERVYTESRDQSDSHLKYDWWDDDWDVDTDHYTERRGVSAANIWSAATEEPKDDTVTAVELAHLMARYDADRNGALTTPEQEAFKAAHPVVMDDWTR
jgi:hypothetical protein